MDISLAPASTLRIGTASSAGELEGLQADWAALFARCPDATPFQSPQWLIPWARHLAEGEVRVVSFWREEGLVAIAPLFVYDGPDNPERQLFLLGVGNSDYLDLLAEPGCAGQAATLLVQYLAQHRDWWDVCDFQQLRPGSYLLEMDIGEPWSSEIMVQEVCPVLPLPAQGSDLKQVIPRHMSEKLAYYRRRAAKQHALSFDHAEPRNVEVLFAAFLQLHSARWQQRGQSGVINEERLEAFHHEVCQGFMNSGMLRLYGLRANARIVGALYAFAAHGRTFHYLGGFNPEYSGISPGSLLIGHAIEQALAEKDFEFDFLRGREAYKYMWGAKGRLNCRRRLRLHPAQVGKPRVASAPGQEEVYDR